MNWIEEYLECVVEIQTRRSKMKLLISCLLLLVSIALIVIGAIFVVGNCGMGALIITGLLLIAPSIALLALAIDEY